MSASARLGLVAYNRMYALWWEASILMDNVIEPSEADRLILDMLERFRADLKARAEKTDISANLTRWGNREPKDCFGPGAAPKVFGR